jgi:hypothetical protein
MEFTCNKQVEIYFFENFLSVPANPSHLMGQQGEIRPLLAEHSIPLETLSTETRNGST